MRKRMEGQNTQTFQQYAYSSPATLLTVSRLTLFISLLEASPGFLCMALCHFCLVRGLSNRLLAARMRACQRTCSVTYVVQGVFVDCVRVITSGRPT